MCILKAMQHVNYLNPLLLNKSNSLYIAAYKHLAIMYSIQMFSWTMIDDSELWNNGICEWREVIFRKNCKWNKLLVALLFEQST